MLQTFTSTHLNRYPPAGSPNKTQQRLRIITATSLFDGHDAAINIMRRIMQSQGVEVIHLGHNRSVTEIVHAAIQEDVDAIAISSCRGIASLHTSHRTSIRNCRGNPRFGCVGIGK